MCCLVRYLWSGPSERVCLCYKHDTLRQFHLLRVAQHVVRIPHVAVHSLPFQAGTPMRGACAISCPSHRSWLHSDAQQPSVVNARHCQRSGNCVVTSWPKRSTCCAGAIGQAQAGSTRAPDLTASHPWHKHLTHPDVQHRVDSVSPAQQYPDVMHVVFCQGVALAYPRYIVTY